MHDDRYSVESSNGYYIGNDPIYRNNYPSTFTLNPPTNYLRHSYSPSSHEDIHLQQNKQSNHPHHCHGHMINLQQERSQQANLGKYNFENRELSSTTAYYNRIHAQSRSNTRVNPQQNPSIPVLRVKRSKDTLPIRLSDPSQKNPIVLPTDSSFRISSQPQLSIPNRTSLVDPPVPKLQRNNDEPLLDYQTYTMDSLIQYLVPSDTYKPKDSFIYPMLMCSRMHIRPSLLLNKLAYLTITSVKTSSHDRGVRIMQHFLDILSQWTRTFPYDFRNNEMITQLHELLRKINTYESTLQSDTHHVDKKLHSKLKALENYEEYIQQLNKKALHCLTQTALYTDIINECPTSILFAQQLTHIELDRLKPIGAEELIQYFIMKSASEEARAHPNRTHNTQTTTSNNTKSLDFVHDIKLTFSFETYVQWSNRLTFFVITEIVKHTQRRLRIRLIDYFIETAYECLRLHNFNSMFGIIGGLNMQPVKRLKKTWEKSQLEKLEQLEEYINATRNFAHYRRALKTAMEEAKTHGWRIDNIVIPFTSLILQDVYYIKTHSKDYTPEGGINLHKYYSMGKFILEEFMQCKQSKCSFERNDVIINYIITSPTFDEDSLMLASFECEPPATANEKEKFTLLQASVNTSSSKT